MRFFGMLTLNLVLLAASTYLVYLAATAIWEPNSGKVVAVIWACFAFFNLEIKGVPWRGSSGRLRGARRSR